MIERRTVNLAGAVVRVGFGALGLAAVIYQLVRHVDLGAPLLNFFSYFTILSNIFAGAVLLVSGLLSVRRRPIWWNRVRGAATLYMVMTGIIFNTLLLNADVGNLADWVNNVHHRLIPIVMLADWLLAPPRGRIHRRTVLRWLAFPIVYCLYSLARGPFADFYPYPFLDPRLAGGYPRVAIFIAGLAVAVAGLAVLVAWVGNRLSARSASRSPIR